MAELEDGLRRPDGVHFEMPARVALGGLAGHGGELGKEKCGGGGLALDDHAVALCEFNDLGELAAGRGDSERARGIG